MRSPSTRCRTASSPRAASTRRAPPLQGLHCEGLLHLLGRRDRRGSPVIWSSPPPAISRIFHPPSSIAHLHFTTDRPTPSFTTLSKRHQHPHSCLPSV
ncbi:hypothetical protein FOCC_FOCC009298 [Frankliniella occidentalis]|nr:hypothetical protein FOCC_FOCC009298 [Frankliniella occidentalis]